MFPDPSAILAASPVAAHARTRPIPRLPLRALPLDLPSVPAVLALETIESPWPWLNLPPSNFPDVSCRYLSGNACPQTEASPRLHTPFAEHRSTYCPWRSPQTRVLRSLQSSLLRASCPRAAPSRLQRAPHPPIRESLFPSQTSP